MKSVIFAVIIAGSVLTVGCRKKTENSGLPQLTQQGKNTLGFLLNGEPWTPKGAAGGLANLTINIDPGFRNGVLSITAKRFIGDSISHYFGLGISDSLNHLTPPFTLALSTNGIYRVFFLTKDCEYRSYDSSTRASGNLTVSTFDKVNGIFAGTFNLTLSQDGCGTLAVSEGRFDLKF